MRNFQLMTKVILATCFVAGLSITSQMMMSKADGGEYNQLQSRLLLSRANYNPSLVHDQPGRSRLRGDDSDRSRGQFLFRDRYRDSDRWNRYSPRWDDYNNTNASYRHGVPPYRRGGNRYCDELSRYPSPYNSRLYNNRRDNRFGSPRRDRIPSDRYRFDDRSGENRYRGGQFDAQNNSDRLTPVSYESNRQPVSNQGRSPFFE